MALWIAAFPLRAATTCNRLAAAVLNRLAGWLEPPGRFVGRLAIVRASILSILLGVALMSVGQARDLLLDVDGSYGHWAFVFAMVLLFWCLPVHYSARLALTDSEGIGAHKSVASTWLPRLLGLLPIPVIAFSAFETARNLNEAADLNEVQSALASIDRLYIVAVIAAIVFIVYVNCRLPLLNLFVTEGRPKADKAAGFMLLLGYFLIVLPWIYLLTILAFFAACIYFPFFVSGEIGRIVLLPVLLGGWLPIAIYLFILANRTRFPVPLAIVAILFVASSFSNRFHDLRTLPIAAAASGPSRQADLAQAIKHWKAANHCDGHDACPAPILIAAEGGASRAAFHLATVVGSLLDATAACKDCAWAGDTIFAISGVSGGAFGAATIRAALAESPGDRHPVCTKTDPAWFGADRADIPRPTQSWRSCLQSLTTGDYLTPALVGLAYRDWLALPTNDGRSFFSDRTALLEEAIERHYNDIVGNRAAACPPTAGGKGLCAAFGYLDQRDNHVEMPWLPLLFLNATTVETGRQLVVSDVFLSSCTATDRLTFSDFMPATYDLFEVMAAQSVPWHETDCRASKEAIANSPDIRLSTAAVLGARFPIISSPANIRMLKYEKGGDSVVMQVVDGGYFDNSGLVTLRFLAKELIAQGLNPVILRLSNDPTPPDTPYLMLPGRTARTFTDPNKVPEVRNIQADKDTDPEKVQQAAIPAQQTAIPVGPLLETPIEKTWIADASERVGSPLIALNGARQGHGELEREAIFEVVNLPQIFDDTKLNWREQENYFVSTVSTDPINADDQGTASSSQAPADSWQWCRTQSPGRPVMKAVSMSWWMSPPVQAFLDLQLCNKRTASYLDALVSRERRPYTSLTRLPPTRDIMLEMKRSEGSAGKEWDKLVEMSK